MPTLSVDTVRSEDVTFVELLVEADHPHRVRIAFHHDGPVWPPRADGRPEDGWDDGGVTTRVDAGLTPLGFATSTPPAGVAVELVEAAPIEPDGAPEGVRSWLRRVEGRVEAAERLTAVDDVPAATRALASVGGLSGLEALAGDVARDRRLVSRLSVARTSSRSDWRTSISRQKRSRASPVDPTTDPGRRQSDGGDPHPLRLALTRRTGGLALSLPNRSI